MPNAAGCSVCGVQFTPRQPDSIEPPQTGQPLQSSEVITQPKSPPEFTQFTPPKAPKLTAKQMAEQQQHIIQKQQQFIEQLRVDVDDLQYRLITLWNLYIAEHRNYTPWTRQVSSWVAILCAIALTVVLYLWIKSEGGLSAIMKMLPK